MPCWVSYIYIDMLGYGYIDWMCILHQICSGLTCLHCLHLPLYHWVSGNGVVVSFLYSTLWYVLPRFQSLFCWVFWNKIIFLEFHFSGSA